MKFKTRVALVIGGASPERQVSKYSGKGVMQALINLGYEFTLIDPAFGSDQPTQQDEFFSEEEIRPFNSSNFIQCVQSNLFKNIDTVFNGLHGKFGEDGMIQSLFEFAGLRYTGSGVLASSISMNKSFTKAMFKHYGVNTPDWIIVSKQDNSQNVSDLINNRFGYPCVVKPNDQGSAIGLSICSKPDELEAAIKLAHDYSNEAIIEEYIDGYEITVGILNDEPLPVLEIKPKHEFYDYTCKYTHGMSEYLVPADLPKGVSVKLQDDAIKAYQSVGCSSYGRIDFRLNKNYEPFCLEVNTLPGLTSTSLLPKAAKAHGISFEDLIDRIIKNSLY